MNLVPKELIQVVVPSAKRPWGILLLKLVSAAGDIVSIASAATTVSAATTTTATITIVNDITLAQALIAEQEVVANKENDELNVVEEIVEVINTVNAATTTTDDDGDITLAQALEEMKSTKPKKKGVVIQELGESTTTISSQLSSQQSQDKGKGILIEPVKPMNKKDLIRLDEETALNLQAEFDEEERLAREKAEKEEEANIALIETWDDIQAKIDADHQLAERMQAQEQEELSIEEKATLFQQLLEKRRKHFAAKRAEEKRNKPPTKAQQRKIMCTYLKNMEGYKLKDLKLKEFDSIQEMFDRAFKRVNTFEDFRTELVEGKEKRAGTELVQESTKKQKVEDDKETAELKQRMEIIPDEEEVAIDAIPLAVKSPSIVGWKIYKEGRKSYYQIMRADGKSQTYMIFSHMLKSFDREDLENLYKLVKAKYESTRPVEDLDLILWGDLKIMFEPHIEDKVWKNQQDYKVLNWKLYDSCGVHSLRMQHVQIYMLVEKKYPLTPSTLTMMLEKKLMIDYESEMDYQLLKFNVKQLKNKLGGRTREKTIMKDQEHPEKCGETMTRAIIRAMVNKLPEESFSGVSEDKGDLEGIIDYLEPTLYDGFINPNDEAYKQRMNKFLGMPNTEPPLILKEEAEITRYNLGLEKFSQKLKS
ncbi:hypothetical protein Tco_0738068 [Tanacetum coccineum]